MAGNAATCIPCSVSGMQRVRDAACQRCSVSGMQRVRDAACQGCSVSGMQRVGDDDEGFPGQKLLTCTCVADDDDGFPGPLVFVPKSDDEIA